MKTAGANIVQGVTIGVASGLILVLFVWVWNSYDQHRERQEQIDYLSATIQEHRLSIEEAEGFYHEALDREFNRDELRKAYLDSMYRRVLAILDGRASRLTFDEVHELRQVFFALERHPNWIPNDRGYRGLFNDLEAVEWLDLEPLQ